MTENTTPTLGLYGKMAKIMGEMQHIPKNGTNSFFNYKFVSEGDVSDVIRTHLAAHNIALFSSMTKWSQTQFTTAKGKTSNKTICEFEFTLVCADSGTSRTSTWCAEADDEQDKGFNKAATAAMKYWLLKTFMIPTGDDPDADNNKEQGKDKPAGRGVKVEKPAQPKAAPQPETQKPAEPPPVASKGYQIHELYNAVLKTEYANNNFHMKGSIQKLIDAGTLKPEMTLEKAIEIVKAHRVEKDAESQKKGANDDQLPRSKPPSVTAAEKPTPAETDKIVYDDNPHSEAEARTKDLARLENEEAQIYEVTRDKHVQGKGKAAGDKWLAKAQIFGAEHEERVDITLFPEDVTVIKKAGHYFPAIDGPVSIPVIIHIEDFRIRINREKQPKKTPNPFNKPSGSPEFDAIPSANAQPTMPGMPRVAEPM